MKYRVMKTNVEKYAEYCAFKDNEILMFLDDLNLDIVRASENRRVYSTAEEYTTLIAEADTLELLRDILEEKYPEDFV